MQTLKEDAKLKTISHKNIEQEILETPVKSKKPTLRPLKQLTLNGLQSDVKDHESESDVYYWGGIRVNGGSPGFGKKKDGTTSWEAAYFNG